MVCQDARTGAAGNVRGPRRRQRLQMLRDTRAVRSHQHLAPGLEKQIDPFPLVSDQAGAGADRLEYAGRGREPVTRHAVAVDVEGGEPGAEERIM